MEFKQKIIELENTDNNEKYIEENGTKSVIITAVHTMKQNKIEGIKKSEPFTKAIARYVSKEANCFSYIKLKDNGVDSNSEYVEQFKVSLLNTIKENNIKLLIDVHGAKEERDFDVELGTLNNLSIDDSTLKELKEAFNHNGINNIKINDPFKGGGITKYIYANSNIDIIQIEINHKYRNIDNFKNIEKICESLIYFINQYDGILNK